LLSAAVNCQVGDFDMAVFARKNRVGVIGVNRDMAVALEIDEADTLTFRVFMYVCGNS